MRSLLRKLPVLVLPLAAACGAHVAPAAVAPVSVMPASIVALDLPAVAAVPDTSNTLVSMAEEQFRAGEAASGAGRLEAARDHFDRAVDMLLSAPGGARSTPAAAEALDRLLDRISALDVLALREGDGFTEAQSEPAAIDELLGAAGESRPAPALSTEELVADDLVHTSHDVPITVNSRVLSYVELFQGNMRPFIEEGLSRSMQYLPMIEDVFREEGVPLDLAYVPLVESAFKPNALSRASARGLWQFVQGTAFEHGLERDWFIDERSDPEKATRAAATYLKTLVDMFDGDWNLALASYNAGPGRVQRAIKSSKSTDYWKITETSRYLPRETREYVPMILAAIIIARNPDRYGFDVGPAAPVAFEKVTVPDAIDLKYIAEWAGVPVSEIQALNPELRRTTTPAKAHDLKVPVGTAAAVEARLATADPTLYVAYKSHTVKKGETLTSIARQYKLTTTELRSYNDLKSNARLRVGQALMIPERRATTLPTRTAADDVPATYRVRAGDTLTSIARRFDTTVSELKALNQLSSDAIRAGDRLTIRR